MSAAVYIAIYKPRQGNFYHWALFVDNNGGQIYEVISEHPTFEYDSRQETPLSSTDHKEKILVGYVNQSDLPKIHEMLPKMNIDNENSGWCCQDWVLESLEELCDEFYLDADDDDYQNGVREAKKRYFGPV